MSKANLATYLNDHLAGSVVALEMLEHLENAHAGTELERFLASIRADILADRKELEAFMARLDISLSPPRRAMAWLTEKFAELKLSLDDPAGGPLHLLEALEAISLGIEGKRSLWRALSAVHVPGMRLDDLQRLEWRAGEQRDRMEAARLEAAIAALADEPAM